MKFKILLAISKFRGNVLKNILYLSGFKIIRDHWIYTRELSSNSVVIDLGANTGTFSDILINDFQSKCFAVEPNLTLFNNLNNNKLTKVNAAVTKNDGPVEFFISENHEASSINNNFQTLWSVAEKQTIDGISWESLLTKLSLNSSNIEVLKMDVEGAELDIIDTLNGNNTKNVRQVTIEFHHHLNPGLHDRTRQSIKKLLSLGYTGIANSISPTEVLFLKESNYRFTLFQKVMLAMYKQLRFSPY